MLSGDSNGIADELLAAAPVVILVWPDSHEWTVAIDGELRHARARVRFAAGEISRVLVDIR